MTTAPATRLVTLSQDQMRQRLNDALDLYVTAMRYPPGTAVQRTPVWLDHIRRAGWRGVAALDGGDAMVGVAYGYLGAPGQWWFEQVRQGLDTVLPADQVRTWLTGAFELTELHVRPDSQGHGIGEQLLRTLLGDPPPAERVLLSTPEGPSRAWRLYRRVGFVELLRHYRFAGDVREFAVLGRSLPF